MTIFANPDALLATAEQLPMALGTSDWLEVTQERIDQFANATGDHQWIHVDPERAREGPFGACIAHGFLTLALTSSFLPQLCDVREFGMGINYGSDRVRYPTPVPVGSQIRGHGKLISAQPVGNGGVQIIVRVSIELGGHERPACVADIVSRYLP